MTIDELKQQRAIAWKRRCASHKLFMRSQRLYEKLKENYTKDEKAYRDIDHELALLDGRLQVVQPEVKHSKVARELTLEDIQEIAARLGIDLGVTPEIHLSNGEA